MNFNFLLSPYLKKNGTQLIRLKIETSQSDTQYIDSGVSVKKNQWDNNKKKVRKHPLEENLSGTLNSLLLKVQKLHYANPEVSAKRLAFIYKNRKNHDTSSFIKYYQSINDEARLRGNIRTAITQDKYIVKLKLFSGDVKFSDINKEFIKDFELWMLKKGNKTNTIASNLKCIYAVLNKAVRIGLIKDNPIRGYKIKSENTEKESLTYEEIQKLENLDLHQRYKGMIVAIDLFLFSFYSAGMRFSDMCKLKWVNIAENDIVYTMGKARSRSGSKRTIPLNPKSKAILEKYKGKNETFVFPPLYNFDKKTPEEIEYKIYISNNSLNRSIKIASKRIGLKKSVNMHMAKHSFASHLVKNKVNLLILSKLLGHTKLATTQAYLKDFYNEEQSAEMERVFG